MAQVYKKLEIDVNKEVTSIITAVQNDTKSRYLDVVLLDGSTPINLTGHEVRIYGKKADGTEFYNNGAITNATAGRCQFELTSQALVLAQDLEVQIILFKNDVEVLSTQPFKIHIVKSLISAGAVESSNEYGALVVLYQNLYEAHDLMTTMVQNIGVPGEIAEQLTIDTMWDAWEYLCNYVSEDLTTLLQNAINNNSVDGVMQRLGNTADTGGTATAGTVMGKLNSVITGTKYKSFKRLEATVPINQTNYTILNVSGAGEFYGIYGNYFSQLKVIADGVTHAISSNYSNFYGFKPGIDSGIYNAGTGAGSSAYDANAYAVKGTIAMPFKNSLVIQISTTDNSSYSKTSYAIYE